ncbi:hypothetical protein AB0J80_35915 [Actinoplanes sp. NPDC049548]|uniref:hypothetical protein n=1 Tax=Actinoplanes sp. NPDC049548 TaxID=3155152 RepID=UPI00342187E1
MRTFADLDNQIMAFATALRVAGYVEDAEGVESSAAYLREEIRQPQARMDEALLNLRDACQSIVDTMERRQDFVTKEIRE